MKLHYLGEPFVEMNGVRLSVPLRKAEAILFYVALEGRIPRDRLKLLFWGDKDEDQASNNLRNTIYLLRKSMPGHFVVDRRYVYLEGCETDIDATATAALVEPDRPIDAVFFEEPLRGFDALGSEEFDDWLVVARNLIKKRIVDSLRLRIKACYESELREELTESLSALLAFEPFDEDSVLELMEAWSDLGYAAKAVSLYNNFRKRMESEIGIQPSERAELFFKRTLAAGTQADDARHPGEFFCCRETEVKRILSLAESGRHKMQIVFVHGEAGVGKTSLVNRVLEFLAPSREDVFTARPHSVGEKYPYSSWNAIAAQIERKLREHNISLDAVTASALSGVFYDFMKRDASPSVDAAMGVERNPVTIGRILAELLSRIVPSARPVFVLEDLHWFDPQSLLLLRSFLSEVRVPVSMFLTSRPESAPQIQELLYALRSANPFELLTIPLAPLDADDTMRFCRACLSEEVISRRGEGYFVKESEGLPLLLVEMIRILSDNPDADCSDGLSGVIMSRLEGASQTQRTALEVLAVFGRGASLDDIASAMGLPAKDLIEPLEGLFRKKLLLEITEKGEARIDFFHANVRECIYESIPGFKKREYHNSIARVLSERYSPQVWNPSLSAVLCHHYRMAGLRAQELRQHLREMVFHIALNHVLFPLVQDRVLLSCSVPFSSRQETEYKIDHVRNLLRELEEEGDADDVNNRRLEASYLEIWGGYLVNWGEYRQGRILINRALAIAREHGFDEIRVHCLEHIAHHFLQTDESEKLLATSREILHLSKAIGKEHHVGQAIRFIGMSKLIEGDFDQAERIFQRSIDLFEELGFMGRNYTLNQLAPRCYVGEMRQWRGDVDTAMAHFTHCIDKCSGAGLFWGRSHFHAHAADTALDMGDWDLLYRHIDTGVALFESSRGGHCGSLLYSLKAIADARRGRVPDALTALRNGDFLSAIGKKTWCAPQLMAKAWMAHMLERGEIADDEAREFLRRPASLYAEAAEELYREIGAAGRANFIRATFLPKD